MKRVSGTAAASTGGKSPPISRLQGQATTMAAIEATTAASSLTRLDQVSCAENRFLLALFSVCLLAVI